MIDAKVLARALALQEKGYQLILWLSDLADRAKLSFDQVHTAASTADAARGWVERNYSTIPARCRPDREDLHSFANVVASFLASSFDLIREPGKRWTSDCGCYCSWCGCAVNAPHLQLKKLNKKNKERAWELQMAALLQHAIDEGRPLSREDAILVMGTEQLRPDTAILAYSRELLRRLEGHFEGPAVLALWRQFAWEDTTPKKNYKLSIELYREAKARVDAALQKLRTPG